MYYNDGVKRKTDPFAKKDIIPVRRAENRSPEVIELVHDYLSNEMMEYLRAADDLAKGIYEVEEIDGGERRVYRRPPDREMLKYLMDRELGRPIARSEAGQIGETHDYEDFLTKRIGVIRPIRREMEGKIKENLPNDERFKALEAPNSIDPEMKNVLEAKKRLLGVEQSATP